VRIHAFVLMANHYHLIASFPVLEIGIVMRELLKTVAWRLNQETRTKGHLFGGPYRATLITSERHYADTIKYVYRNPVKAGVCNAVEDYPFSTLHGQLGFAPLE